MTTETGMDVPAIADALAAIVMGQVGRIFEPAEEATEILSVYFQPPTEGQSADDYRHLVLEPVGTALAQSLEKWTASVPLADVIGAAACARVTVDGLHLRVTESRQWDERVRPQEGRVELRVEAGVA